MGYMKKLHIPIQAEVPPMISVLGYVRTNLLEHITSLLQKACLVNQHQQDVQHR